MGNWSYLKKFRGTIKLKPLTFLVPTWQLNNNNKRVRGLIK